MTSDASGSWGCGAWHGSAWFQVQWDVRSQPLTIAERELIPIVLGCTAWGQSWSGHRVECFCDNQVIISCIRSRTSRNKGLMHLLLCLVYVEARFSFAIVPLYINTKANVLADVTTWPLFSRRYPRQTPTQHQSRPSCWTFS